MPRCLHPDETFDVVLASDEHLPEEERPFFTFRPFSIRQWREAMKGMQHVQSLQDDKLEHVEIALGAVCDVLRSGLVGWGNMLDHNVAEGAEPVWVPYDPDLLDTLIDLDEANELLDKMMKSGQLSSDDKKKFASPPSSDMSSSARAAPRTVARTRPAR